MPQPALSLGGHRKRRPQTYNDILRAMVDLLYEQDYHSTTLEQIAHRVGVSPGAVYRHFKNKQAVLDAAAAWAADMVFERLGDGRTADGSVPSLEALVDAVIGLLRDRGEFVSILERHLHVISVEVRASMLARAIPLVMTWDDALTQQRPELARHERHVMLHGVLVMLAGATTAPAGLQRAGPVLRRMALAALAR